MENIFNAKDIRDKLKTEHDDFRAVINQYSEILKEIKVEHQGNIYSYLENKTKVLDNLKKVANCNLKLAAVLKEVER